MVCGHVRRERRFVCQPVKLGAGVRSTFQRRQLKITFTPPCFRGFPILTGRHWSRGIQVYHRGLFVRRLAHDVVFVSWVGAVVVVVVTVCPLGTSPLILFGIVAHAGVAALQGPGSSERILEVFFLKAKRNFCYSMKLDVEQSTSTSAVTNVFDSHKRRTGTRTMCCELKADQVCINNFIGQFAVLKVQAEKFKKYILPPLKVFLEANTTFFYRSRFFVFERS